MKKIFMAVIFCFFYSFDIYTHSGIQNGIPWPWVQIPLGQLSIATSKNPSLVQYEKCKNKKTVQKQQDIKKRRKRRGKEKNDCKKVF